MKLVCQKKDLIEGINIAMKAVSAKTTMSILECILIDANEGVIKFTSNNMELGIETIVDGEIIESGSIAIDAKLFSEIIRKLPDNEVKINATDENKNAEGKPDSDILRLLYDCNHLEKRILAETLRALKKILLNEGI